MHHLLLGAMTACLIIGAGVGFCLLARWRLAGGTRRALKQAKADGYLPTELHDVDLDSLPSDVGVPVSRSNLRIAAIAHWLADFAVLLIPLVIASCLIVAYFLGRTSQF